MSTYLPTNTPYLMSHVIVGKHGNNLVDNKKVISYPMDERPFFEVLLFHFTTILKMQNSNKINKY